MWRPPTPGLPGWSRSCSVALVLLEVLVFCSSGNACCLEEQGPTTDCSFSHGQDTFGCDIAERGYFYDTCPDEGIAPLDDIPRPVLEDSFNIDPYFTSCPPSSDYMYKEPLVASSCHTPCSHGNGTVHAGLNITFKADPWTSEHLQAITISLRHDTSLSVHCVTFRFRNGLLQEALKQHEFFYDGFIGLIPGERYTVSVLTLPTSTQWDNYVSKRIRIPWESCWVPDIKIHETPFVINFTLFQDLSYGFQRFDVHLYHDPYNPRTLPVDFSTADIYEMDGKNGTNILFDCIEPTTTKLKLYVASEECEFCQWNMTRIKVHGVPPKFTDCPEHDIIREVEMRKPMVEITPIHWSPPTPVFQGSCGSGHNSSRDPANTAFRIGTTTAIRNLAWQYSSISECTFNVQVRAVDTTPPKIICPDNISMYGDPKNKTFEVSWPKPSFYDASDTNLTIVTPDIPTSQTSYNFPVFVNTTVKYQITDAHNNVASCRFYVYVKGDTDPPRILYCPRNINVNGQPKMKSAEIHWDRPQSIDASNTIMTIVTPKMSNDETFFTFTVGVNTTVKYKITDAYNNTAYCSFSVYIKDTPAASPLVITLSCLAGVLLIVVVMAIVYANRCRMIPNKTGSKEKFEPKECGGVIFRPVNPLKTGIGLDSLIEYPESQLSIDGSLRIICPSHQGLLERCKSQPDMQPQSSGFFEDEFIPSFGHPPSRLESVAEEEKGELVWTPIKQDRSSNGSRYSSYYSDDSPVSLESTC